MKYAQKFLFLLTDDLIYTVNSCDYWSQIHRTIQHCHHTEKQVKNRKTLTGNQLLTCKVGDRNYTPKLKRKGHDQETRQRLFGSPYLRAFAHVWNQRQLHACTYPYDKSDMIDFICLCFCYSFADDMLHRGWLAVNQLPLIC